MKILKSIACFIFIFGCFNVYAAKTPITTQFYINNVSTTKSLHIVANNYNQDKTLTITMSVVPPNTQQPIKVGYSTKSNNDTSVTSIIGYVGDTPNAQNTILMYCPGTSATCYLDPTYFAVMLPPLSPPNVITEMGLTS